MFRLAEAGAHQLRIFRFQDCFELAGAFFQGGEDRVVPPSQAERMVDALREKGVAVEYHLFPNEGHGFRRAENIVTATEAELRFFQSILGRS